MIEQVQAEDLAQSGEELAEPLAGLAPGFRLLTDLGRLDSLSVSCAAEIGKMMELFDQKGVEMVVGVIPDPKKDIGLNILALFHYRHPPRTFACENMVEAAKLPSL